MSNDRELLQAAAKAAGLEFNRQWFGEQSGLLVWQPPEKYESWDWNPLQDDAQALRLLVQLDMEIHGGRKPVNFREVIFMLEGEPHSEEISPEDPDQDAATRRAIVRAAAAIGGAA